MPRAVRRNRGSPRAVDRRMRTVARWNVRGFDLRTLVALGLSLVLAACNNGGKPGY